MDEAAFGRGHTVEHFLVRRYRNQALTMCCWYFKHSEINLVISSTINKCFFLEFSYCAKDEEVQSGARHGGEVG